MTTSKMHKVIVPIDQAGAKKFADIIAASKVALARSAHGGTESNADLSRIRGASHPVREGGPAPKLERTRRHLPFYTRLPSHRTEIIVSRNETSSPTEVLIDVLRRLGQRGAQPPRHGPA